MVRRVFREAVQILDSLFFFHNSNPLSSFVLPIRKPFSFYYDKETFTLAIHCCGMGGLFRRLHLNPHILGICVNHYRPLNSKKQHLFHRSKRLCVPWKNICLQATPNSLAKPKKGNIKRFQLRRGFQF